MKLVMINRTVAGRSLVAAICAFALVGCGGGGSSGASAPSGAALPVPVPTPTPTATSTPVPTPSPTPSSSPSPTPSASPVVALHGVVAEGDSITVWGYAGIYTQQHPTVEFHNLAVGGSTTANLTARVDAVLALRPAVVTVLIGTNDCCGPNWATNLFSYVALLRASGAKVAVGTILPKYEAGWSLNDDWEAARLNANATIRAAVGTKIDAVFDFAADPVMGQYATARNTQFFQDGVHPTEAGHQRLEPIYAAVMDRLLAN